MMNLSLQDVLNVIQIIAVILEIINTIFVLHNEMIHSGREPSDTFSAKKEKDGPVEAPLLCLDDKNPSEENKNADS